MTYSITDILSFYKNIEDSFIKTYENLKNVTYKEQFLNLSGGLAATNSIHEMFIKSILKRHQGQHEISSSKYAKLVRKYKSPIDFRKFIIDLELDLDEAFLFYIEDLKKDFPYISTLDEVIATIKLQRESRNKYLHGEFSLEGPFSFNLYENEVINFRKLHFFLITLVDYSYTKNYDAIIDLTSKLVDEKRIK